MPKSRLDSSTKEKEALIPRGTLDLSLQGDFLDILSRAFFRGENLVIGGPARSLDHFSGKAVVFPLDWALREHGKSTITLLH